MPLLSSLLKQARIHSVSRRQRPCGSPVSTEALEQRLLLTASLSNRILRIEGTEAADTITIEQDAKMLTVSQNGEDDVVFPTGKVDQVRIFGFGGADVINVRDIGEDTQIFGGAGPDQIHAGLGDNTLRGGGGSDTIIGYNGNDRIAGGGGNDLLRGQAGNDVVSGDNGNDTVYGAAGFDEVNGGNGNDMMFGNGDDDVMDAGIGRDQVWGGNGNDMMIGAGGNDVLVGGAGNDSIFGGSGADKITGGTGSDMLLGGNGRDHIDAGRGRDVLVGGLDRDTLLGGNDDDLLIGGTTILDNFQMGTVADEWRSGRDYEARRANIRKGQGRTDSRLNGDNFLVGRNRNAFATVDNDYGYIDDMFGNEGRDWFFLAEGFGDDDVNDRLSDELRDVV